jgi:4-azaleucine resistance transporter AzlC
LNTVFTAAGLLRGARLTLPVLIGVIPFGIVTGIAAQGAGLSMVEAGLMSATVFAGAAQLLALSHWTHPADVLAAAVATLSVNARLILLGPVLAPFLARVRGWRLHLSLFVMTDQNWALAVTEMRGGGTDAAFLLGSGGALWLWWVVLTLIGHAAGAALRPPPDHPLYFAALAVFISLLVPMWRGRRDALPWLVSAAVAVTVARAIPGGSIHVVAGALAGAGLAGLRRRA